MTNKNSDQLNSNNQISVGDIDDSIVAIGANIQQNVHIEQRIDRIDARNQRNHAVLRQAVNRFWIDGVLKSSLYKEARIRLKLDENVDAVDNRPWDLILQQPNQPDQSIDEQMPLIDVYDQMGQQLLIMGEPGSGKTTTLLMLTEALLVRAAADPTHPTPVVFNLSSWQSGQLLADWLIEELNQRYQMPKKVSTDWIENDELIPLLDGLDEVDQARRDECVTAINAYRREHVVSMIVCSRTAEYESLTGKLQLQGAVVVRPLTQAQIDGYIADLGPQGEMLAQVLADDGELRELAQTPLMLSVMTLALQGDDRLSDNPDRSSIQRLFDRYIWRMFQHRELEHKYTPVDTLHWLQWLASQMVERSQTLFLIEHLQPDWLGHRLHVNWYRLSVCFLGLIIGIFVFELIPFFGPYAGEYNIRIDAEDLLTNFLIGVLFGYKAKIQLSEKLNYSLRNGVAFGLKGGLMVGLIGVLLMIATLVLMGTKEIFVSYEETLLFLYKIQEQKNIYIVAKYILFATIIYCISMGLFIGLTFLFFLWPIGGFYNIKSWRQCKTIYWNLIINKGLRVFAVCLIINFFFGLLVALSPLTEYIFLLLNIVIFSGLSFYAVRKLTNGLRTSRAKLNIKPNQGIWSSLKRGGSYFVVFLFIGGLLGFLFVEAIKEINLLLNADDQALNENISTIDNATIFYFSRIFAVVFGFFGMLIAGFRCCLQHFTLRTLLHHHNFIPWNYAHFLDYTAERLFLRKVGGGYVFIHRMVLEHIAALTDGEIQSIVGKSTP